MPDEPALDKLVRILTAAVSGAATAQADVVAAEFSAEEAIRATADFGWESDIAEVEALRRNIGQQSETLRSIAKAVEELLQRATALQRGPDGAAPLSNSGRAAFSRAQSDSAIGAAVAAAEAKHAEKRAKKKRQIEATRGDATTKRRLPSTEAMGVGLSSASAASGLLEGLLPQSVHSGINAAIGVAGAAVAGVGWVRYKRGANQDADRSEG